MGPLDPNEAEKVNMESREDGSADSIPASVVQKHHVVTHV